MKHGGGSVMTWAAISSYAFGPIITLNGRITASDYVDTSGNQVHPVVQMLFPNNDVIFKDGISPIHTVRSVLSWFEEHEDALQTFSWPAQSPNVNIIEQLWSVLESRVRSRFPPPSLKQLQDVLQDDWYSIPLEPTRNLYESIWVYSEKDTDCITGKWWLNSLLIKKCVSFTSVSIFFVRLVCIIHVLLCAQYVRYVHNCTEYSCTQFGSLNDFS